MELVIWISSNGIVSGSSTNTSSDWKREKYYELGLIALGVQVDKQASYPSKNLNRMAFGNVPSSFRHVKELVDIRVDEIVRRYGLGLILYRAPCAIKGALRSQRPRGNQRNWNNQKSQQIEKVNFVFDQKAAMSGRKTINAAKPKAVHNAVKASTCWVWKPKNRVIDHVSKYNNASNTLKRFDYIDTQGRFKWMHRLKGGMSMIKNLIQKLLLLVQKLMILLLKLNYYYWFKINVAAEIIAVAEVNVV
ncbi:hypothetical protein Tco_0382621 [Tanacetum coccineum]